MRRLILAVVFCAVPALASAQGNCDNPPTNLVMGVSFTMYTKIPTWNVQEPNGTFQITDLQYALFPAGSDPNTAMPVQGPSTIPRASVSLDTAPDCYKFSAPAGVPTSQQLGASIKYHRAASSGITELFTAYGVPISNSFGTAASALPAPSRLTVR